MEKKNKKLERQNFYINIDKYQEKLPLVHLMQSITTIFCPPTAFDWHNKHYLLLFIWQSIISNGALQSHLRWCSDSCHHWMLALASQTYMFLSSLAPLFIHLKAVAPSNVKLILFVRKNSPHCTDALFLEYSRLHKS